MSEQSHPKVPKSPTKVPSDQLAIVDRLSECRAEIDRIDDQILRLILSRLDVCEQIFQVKQAENLKMRDVAREQQLITRLQAQVENHTHAEMIENIFREISKVCLAYQEMRNNQS
jgi:chorismate mutase